MAFALFLRGKAMEKCPGKGKRVDLMDWQEVCVEWMCVIVFLAVWVSSHSQFIYSIDGPYHVVSYSFNSILTKKINANTLFMSVMLHLIYHSHSCQVCLVIPYTFERCLFSSLSSWSPGIHVWRAIMLLEDAKKKKGSVPFFPSNDAAKNFSLVAFICREANKMQVQPVHKLLSLIFFLQLLI